MSSMSISVSRKRLRSPDFRDSDSDSDDEVPPFKLRKKYGHTERRFPVVIKEKLQNLAVWLSDLNFKPFFTMAIRTGANLHQDVLDDDEDEIPEAPAIDPERLVPLIKKFEQNLYSSSSKKHMEHNGSYSLSSRYDSHRINGSGSSRWKSRHNRNGDYGSREAQTDSLRRPAIISNPDTDIEILLGAKPKVPTPEVDEIEILSESPSTKQTHASSQKSLRASRSSTAKNSDSFMRHSQNLSPAKRQSSSTKTSFTANEVVRLEDKARYKLLIEKYLSGPTYHHVVKKPQTQSTDVAVQADIKFSGSHFKKEVLQQPVTDFIEKYYKPCQLVPSEKAKQTSEKEPPEIVKIDDDDDDDDDLQILEVKLPECKPKINSRKYFSSEWISELKSSVRRQTEERLKIVQDQERTLERIKKERLLKQLRIDAPGSQSVEPEFPELTPEMEEIVDQALNTGAPDDRLCKITSDYLLRKDIETLGGLNWLNDTVINSYFDLIVERSKQEGYPSIHAYNTFFYSTYKTKGYSSVRRWTRKLDIFSFDLNFVPIHLGVHWCLAVIDHRSKKICYYDSMGNDEEKCLDLLHEYLCLEYKDKKGAYLDPCTYTTEIKKDIPQQMNGSDCGMFTLKYAEYISRDAEITFNQGHMQYFRRRMVYELLKSQLL